MLIDPDRLAREIGSDGFLGDPDEGAAATSPEDQQRRAFLRRHADAPGGLFRRHLVADAGTMARLDAAEAEAEAEAPNAARVVEVVRRAASLSWHAGSPLRLPPLLLLGPPGTGKSHIARRIAQALGTPLTTIDGASTTDRGPIVEHEPGYRGACPGKPAVALLEGTTAGPVVLLDEVDKVASYSITVQSLDALSPLLEPTTAEQFTDTYLGLPMRASGVSWILTANSAAGLPAPLLDRVIVIEMPALGRAEARNAVRRMFRELLAEHGLPAAELGDGALKRLDASGLRQARPTSPGRSPSWTDPYRARGARRSLRLPKSEHRSGSSASRPRRPEPARAEREMSPALAAAGEGCADPPCARVPPRRVGDERLPGPGASGSGQEAERTAAAVTARAGVGRRRRRAEPR